MARISQPLFHPSSRFLSAFHVLSFPASPTPHFANFSLSSSSLSAARDGLPRGFRPLWRMQASRRECLLPDFFSAHNVQRMSRCSSPRKPRLASLLPLTPCASALRPHISHSPSKPSSLSSSWTASLSSSFSSSLSPRGHHAANRRISVSSVRWAFSDRRLVSSLQRLLCSSSSSSVSYSNHKEPGCLYLPPLRRFSSSPRTASLRSPSLVFLETSPARLAQLAASSASSSSPPVSGFASLFQKTRRLLKRDKTPSFEWQFEDSVLLLLSLSWIAVACGLFALFQWKTNTREQRHPYLAEARRLVRKHEAVREAFGSPLEFQSAEDSTDSSGLHKRAKLHVAGPKAKGSVFVSAFLPDSVGAGEEEEEDSQSLFAGDEVDWRSLRERPFLLKLWLRDRLRAVHLALRSVALGEVYEDVRRTRGTSSSRTDEEGKEGEEGEGDTGRWTIESLFVHVDKREEGDEKSSRDKEQEKNKVLIAVKGNPYDNPDIDPLIKVEGSSRRNRHPVGAFLLFLLLLLLCRQTFAEIRGAIDRAACYQYLSYFSQNHPDLRRILHQTALRNASVGPARRGTPVEGEKAVPTHAREAATDSGVRGSPANPENHLDIQVSYFAGKMTATSIKGSASLTFSATSKAGGTNAPESNQATSTVHANDHRIPNLAELRIEALRPNASAPFKTLVSSVRVIREASEHDEVEEAPFPLLLSFSLPPTRIPPFRPSVSWSSVFSLSSSSSSSFKSKKKRGAGKEDQTGRKP
ncbi:UNVERIFIED_CONTAM: hypothetical protein HHA_236160 [Hammondia hammondi]|eukprot:XP_008885494.1 hypothetical protein HHA_236160 [Hammondia hammondi]